MKTYEKGFGGKNLLNRMKEEEKEDFYWFLTSVAWIVSGKSLGGASERSKKKVKSYREAVTVTDEAYALMVLQHHDSKWKPDTGEDKKKRVTGGDKEKSMAYYLEKVKKLSELREKNADKYDIGEKWLEEERKKRENNREEDEAEEEEGEAEADSNRVARNKKEQELNPFLQDLVVQNETSV